MTTPLTKALKRELLIQGRPFIVTLSPEGIKLTLKGKRKGQELLWADLVSGEAALAVALNASLKGIPKGGDISQVASAHSSANTAAKSGKGANTPERARAPSPRAPAKKHAVSRASKGRAKRPR